MENMGFSDVKVTLFSELLRKRSGGSYECNRIQNGIFIQIPKGCVSDTEVSCELDQLLEMSK